LKDWGRARETKQIQMREGRGGWKYPKSTGGGVGGGGGGGGMENYNPGGGETYWEKLSHLGWYQGGK